VSVRDCEGARIGASVIIAGANVHYMHMCECCLSLSGEIV